MKLLDTKQAGKLLKISERRVRAICESGRFGTQIAGRWVITQEEVKSFERKVGGRPAMDRKSRTQKGGR